MPTVGVFAAIFDDQKRILCVQRAYGDRGWTTPGGRLEAGESPVDCIVREVQEETGLIVEVGALIGVYSAPFKDDLVVFVHAAVVGNHLWKPDDEIAQWNYFASDELPSPMTERALTSIRHAFENLSNVLHVFE